MQPCCFGLSDCCDSGSHIDPNTSDRDRGWSENRPNLAVHSAAFPVEQPDLPIADYLPAKLDNEPDPCHSDDDRPTMPGLRCFDPATTTKRSCYKDHDKLQPVDTSKVETHSRSVRDAFESPLCPAH